MYTLVTLTALHKDQCVTRALVRLDACHIGLLTLILIPSKNHATHTRPWARPCLQSSCPTIRQHVQAIKQSQTCKCATMPARNTAWSSPAGTDSDHRPKMRHTISGPNECTERDRS